MTAGKGGKESSRHPMEKQKAPEGAFDATRTLDFMNRWAPDAHVWQKRATHVQAET